MLTLGYLKKLMLSTSYHACLQWHLCQRTGEKANTLLESNRCRRPKLIALLTLFQAAKACRLNHYTVTNCAWLYTYVRYIHLYTLFVYIYILYTPSICVTGPLFANPHSKIQMCNPCKFHLLPPWKFLSNCCFWTSAGQQDAGAMLKNSQLTIEHKQYQFQEK